jgi:hypothetical protein
MMGDVERREPPILHRWLDSLPEPAAVQVRAGLDYLTEFGRAAQLDDVRHRIQTSRHYPDMSEVRVLYRTTPHDLVLRVLTVFTKTTTKRSWCALVATRLRGNEQSTVTGTTTPYRSPIRSSTSTNNIRSRRHQ